MPAFVWLRLRARWGLFSAAALTVLLTTCVVATLAAFTGALGDAGLRRTLEHQQAARTTIDVQATLSGPDAPAVDRAVRAALRGAYGALPTTVTSSTQSGPFGLPSSLRPAGTARPAAGTAADPSLTLFATFAPARLTVTAGRLPGAAGRTGPLPVALPEAAARALGVRPGRELTLADRLGGRPVRVRVTGTYRPADPSSPYWRLDPVGGRGIVTQGFTTYGPLLVDPSAFRAGRLAAAQLAWQADAGFGTVTAAGADRLGASVGRAVGRLEAVRGATVQADSGLPGLLASLRRTELISRSALMIDTLELVLLAAFCLLLVAGLLAAERAGETGLLRARGASRLRIAVPAAAEALLLAVPAGVVAPLLAGPLTRLLAAHGALAATGTSLGGFGAAVDRPATWLTAAAAALTCAAAVVVPTLRRTGEEAGGRVRTRAAALPGVLQAGADLALVALAAVAYWQLASRASGGVTSGSGGALGIDPVLVVAPALCLLAGTVVALRLLPPAARLAELRAARGRGTSLALAGWQLARRPRRGTVPALLLVLAIAMGVFATGQSASWARSQADQADFAAGTDVRVTGLGVPAFGQGGIFDALAARHVGITSVAPANRSSLSLPQGVWATVLSVDARAAARSLRLRPDLADRPAAALLRPLYAGDRAALSGPSVPRGTAALRLAVTVTPLGGTADVPETVSVTLADRYDVAYAFPLGEVPADGRPHTLTADLAGAAAAPGGTAAGPLRLVALTADHPVARRTGRQRLTVDALTAVSDSGSATAVRGGGVVWRGAEAPDGDAWVDGPGTARPRAGVPRSSADVPLAETFTLGAQPQAGSDYVTTPPSALLSLAVAQPPLPPLNAVASRAYLDDTGVKVGGSVGIRLSAAQDFTVRITGVVDALPTTSAGAPALLLDLPSVDRHQLAVGGDGLLPTEWWLGTAPGAQARVLSAVRADDEVDAARSRDADLAALRGDPLGAGPQSVLPAAVVAAAVLAAVGFAVSTAGSLRERTAEFAVLRALGMSRRRLAGTVAAEQGALMAVASAVGVGLGAVLTRAVMPLIVLTPQAARPVPPLLVELPAGPTAALVAGTLALPVLVVALTVLRRGDASALRRQEEA